MKPISHLRTVLTLTVICSLCGMFVSAVHVLTLPKIRENEKQKTEQSIFEVFPEAKNMTSTSLSVESSIIEELYRYEDSSTKTGAYAAIAAPKGFQGEIRMCVVVSENGTVLGVRVLSNSETPGLGEKACEAQYLDAYRGLSGPVLFGDKVDAVSGATISSRAVLSAVNEVLSTIECLSQKGAEA